MAQFKIIEMIGNYQMVMRGGGPFSGGPSTATNAIGWITTDTLIPTRPLSLVPGANLANNENFTDDWRLNSAMTPITSPIAGVKVKKEMLHWMCYYNDVLDTSGTYGNDFNNHGRIGTDMTTLDVSSVLTVGTINITVNVSDSSGGIVFLIV